MNQGSPRGSGKRWLVEQSSKQPAEQPLAISGTLQRTQGISGTAQGTLLLALASSSFGHQPSQC